MPITRKITIFLSSAALGMVVLAAATGANGLLARLLGADYTFVRHIDDRAGRRGLDLWQSESHLRDFVDRHPALSADLDLFSVENDTIDAGWHYLDDPGILASWTDTRQYFVRNIAVLSFPVPQAIRELAERRMLAELNLSGPFFEERGIRWVRQTTINTRGIVYDSVFVTIVLTLVLHLVIQRVRRKRAACDPLA